MLLKTVNEESIIALASQLFSIPKDIKGIGDDCAVIPLNSHESLLVTQDNLVEGIHFFSSISSEDLGYKSVMVNISDIAAMGGTPRYVFLGISLPRAIEKPWVESFFRGFKSACEEVGAVLLGGDTVGSLRDVFLSITVIGTALSSHIKYRSRARVGDKICITAPLGGSPVGFQCLQHPISKNDDVQQVVQAHLRPRAHVEEGAFLSQWEEVHAMMDISDGIDSDMGRLIKSSYVGGTIEVDQIPIFLPARRISQIQNWDYESLALTGGEEYCLLVTVDSKKYESINAAFMEHFGHPLYAIGRITEGGLLKYSKNGQPFSLKRQTFHHFGEN